MISFFLMKIILNTNLWTFWLIIRLNLIILLMGLMLN